MSESPLGRGTEGPVPHLSWRQVDRRLEGRPSLGIPHQLCPAQLGSVMLILCVLEHREDSGGIPYGLCPEGRN